jgi:hypothetical protein
VLYSFPRGDGFKYLRVVGANEKGTLFLGDINTEPGPPGWGSLESETVKYGHEFLGTRPQE